MVEETNIDDKALSTELSPSGADSSALSTDLGPLDGDDSKGKGSYIVQAAIFKDMVQASLMIGSMDFFAEANKYLTHNVKFNDSAEEAKFYNEVYTDVFSKFIKSSLNSVESTFESVLTTFNILEEIISYAAGGLITKYDDDGKADYVDKIPANNQVVYEYYSKIATFVYQNSDANAFQKSFYFYTLYNRPFFNQFLEKHQLLFPDIKDSHLTSDIRVLSSQVRYTVSTLSDREELSATITASFLDALASKQWSTQEFYKNSANFAISLCDNSATAELPIEFLTTLSNSLEEKYGDKGTAKLESEIYNQFARVPGKVCYQVYEHFVKPPSYSRAVASDYYNYNAAHVRGYYDSDSKLDIDSLRTSKLEKTSCKRVKDHNLIKDFFIPDTFDQILEKFSRYTDPECFAGLVFQMLSEKESEFIHKIEELLDTEKDNQFKGIIKNHFFWKEINRLLDAHYTINKHTSLCEFWTLRVSEELQNQILLQFKGQDYYGYMRMCELSRMDDSARVKSNIETIIKKYGDTKLLGMVSFMLDENIAFKHNDTYNFYSVIHNAINTKLPLIESAKKEINDQMSVSFVIAAAKSNPQAIRKLLEKAEVFDNFKTLYCQDDCPDGGNSLKMVAEGDTLTLRESSVDAQRMQSFSKGTTISVMEMQEKLHILLNEECHSSMTLSMCERIESFNNFHTNQMTIAVGIGVFTLGCSFQQWHNIYYTAYDGFIRGNVPDGDRLGAANVFFLTNRGIPLIKVLPAFAALGYTVVAAPIVLVNTGIKSIMCNIDDYLHVEQAVGSKQVDFDIRLSPQSCTGNVTYAKELTDDFCKENNLNCNVAISDFE